jgi:hypothetical protein
LQIEVGHFTDQTRNRGRCGMEAARNLGLSVVTKVSRYANPQLRNGLAETFQNFRGAKGG